MGRSSSSAPALAALALMTAASTGGVDAVSYYVSNSGDDTADGLTPSTAWRSLAHASTVRLSGPDDSLLLERGSIFADDFLTLAFPTGILGAYGGANPNASASALMTQAGQPQPRPQIVRRWAPGPVSCVQVMNPDGFTVQDIHFAGCSQGLVIEVTTGANVSDVTLENNFFRDIRAIDQVYNPSKSTWGTAIVLGGGGTLHNFTALHNVGIRMDTFFGMQGVQIDGLILDSNTVAKCGFNCYFIAQGNDMRLRNSVFLHDTSPRLFMYGTTDVIIGTVTGDNAIEVSNTMIYRLSLNTKAKSE